ncbi:MAG: hypothetical protein WA109_13470 [Bellilinea sp.]
MSELLILYNFSVARVTGRPANPSTWNLIRICCSGELSTTRLAAEPALVSGDVLWIVASSSGAKARVAAGFEVGVWVGAAVAEAVSVGVLVSVGNAVSVGVGIMVSVAVGDVVGSRAAGAGRLDHFEATVTAEADLPVLGS